MKDAEEIAHSLGITGKQLRNRLRAWFPNHEHGAPWRFTDEEANDIKRRWRGEGSTPQHEGSTRKTVTFTISDDKPTAAPAPAAASTPARASAPAPAPRRASGPSSGRAASDEHYVIDLCDEILGEAASRQHRFPWLLGDAGRNRTGVALPVDAYYPRNGLVVEYREKQHTESVSFFDKPDRMTVSGVHRGEQRRLYDQRREEQVPAHGLRLVIVHVADLAADRRGRLLRDAKHDRARLVELLHERPSD